MASENLNRYHHGDLRSTLLSTALELLETAGPKALTLRALARKIGVSPMAPYHHFKDREALLVAIATAGFERLQDSKIRIEVAHPQASDALSAGAANFVRFVLENPNLFRLMNGLELDDPDQYPELLEAASVPTRSLARLLAQLCRENDLPEALIEQGTNMIRGVARGIGSLALDGHLPPEEAPSLASKATAAMVQGWISMARDT